MCKRPVQDQKRWISKWSGHCAADITQRNSVSTAGAFDPILWYCKSGWRKSGNSLEQPWRQLLTHHVSCGTHFFPISLLKYLHLFLTNFWVIVYFGTLTKSVGIWEPWWPVTFDPRWSLLEGNPWKIDLSRAELDKQGIHITPNPEANQVKMLATFVAWNFLSP